MKSIIDIDVSSEKFQKFAKLYDQYQAQLAKTPNIWKSVGKEQAATATQFERMTAAMMAQNHLARERDEEDGKHLKQLKTTEQLWSSISRSSTSMFRNVIGVGQSIGKWGGLIAGIATGASLFGIDKLAGSIAGTRQQAMGFGVSPAQLQALRVNFGNVVDPSQLLGTVSGMEGDVTQQGGWRAVSQGRGMSGNVTQDALALLNSTRQWAISHKASQPQTWITLAKALGLPFSQEQLYTMAGTRNNEWAANMSGYARDVKSFGISNQSSLAWTNLLKQFSRSWTTFTDQLALSLGKLTGPLGKLSAALTHAATTLLGSPAVKKGIENLSTWLSNFSSQIDSKAFSDKLRDFTKDVGILLDGLHNLAHPFAALGNSVARSATDLWQSLMVHGSNAAAGLESLYGNNSLDAKRNLPSGSMNFLRLQNDMGGKGLRFGSDLDLDSMAFDFGRETGRYADIKQALAAYALGPGGAGDSTLSGIMSQHPRDWQNFLPQQVQDFVRAGSVAITVTNATGGSASVSVNGLVGAH